MHKAIERWRSLSDGEMDRICENLVAIHLIMMGFVLVGFRLLPLLRGVSPEVVFGSLF